VYPAPARQVAVSAFLFSTLILGACQPSQSAQPPNTHKETVPVDKLNPKDFAAALQQVLPAADTTDSLWQKTPVHSVGQIMRLAYMQHQYHPLWVRPNGALPWVSAFLQDLDSLQWDGLQPERYHYTALMQQYDRLQKTTSPTLADYMALDTALTASYLSASHDLLLGVISPKTADSDWFHVNDTLWQAAKLLLQAADSDTYAAMQNYRSAIPTYAYLRSGLQHYQAMLADSSWLAALSKLDTGALLKNTDSLYQYVIQTALPWFQVNAADTFTPLQQALRAYQYYNGLKVTGRADKATVQQMKQKPDKAMQQMQANLERLRWLPQRLEDQYVLVNIPLMELFYRKDDTDALHMRVVVGRPTRPTPSLNARMVNIVFSPSWGVPPTILKKDVLPGMIKSGAAYLKKKGLYAYDRNGKQVDASRISEANYRSYTYRQPPGARNSLGEIKFNLPNKWDIYLHDTPHKEDFPKFYRAYSSGCIRVQHPRRFAELILSDIEGKNFTQGIIDSIIQTRRTRYEILNEKIPVHIVYLTAFEDSLRQNARLIADIYSRDHKLIALLHNYTNQTITDKKQTP
jgi:murein L,D-transpeptidase YcbB/YkuD